MQERISVAVVGAGQWGPNLIRNLHNQAGSRVAAIVDQDARRLEQIRARYPDIRTAQQLEQVLDDGVDAVVIATPTRTHHALAKLALERGKHVLVEKPMAHSVALAEDLARLANERERVLCVGHVFVHNPAFQQVRDCLERGLLGRLYYISAERTNLGPVRPGVNVAWDLAAHDISIVSYWLGEQPSTVRATGGAWLNEGLEDAVFAVLRYPQDVLLNLHVSWLNPRKVRLMTVVGADRMLTIDDMAPLEPVRIYDRGIDNGDAPIIADTDYTFRATIREGDITIPRVRVGEPLQNECAHFLDCIRAGRQSELSGPQQGVAVVRVLEALDRSLQEGGREVEV